MRYDYLILAGGAFGLLGLVYFRLFLYGATGDESFSRGTMTMLLLSLLGLVLMYWLT